MVGAVLSRLPTCCTTTSSVFEGSVIHTPSSSGHYSTRTRTPYRKLNAATVEYQSAAQGPYNTPLISDHRDDQDQQAMQPGPLQKQPAQVHTSCAHVSMPRAGALISLTIASAPCSQVTVKPKWWIDAIAVLRSARDHSHAAGQTTHQPNPTQATILTSKIWADQLVCAHVADHHSHATTRLVTFNAAVHLIRANIFICQRQPHIAS